MVFHGSSVFQNPSNFQAEKVGFYEIDVIYSYIGGSKMAGDTSD